MAAVFDIYTTEQDGSPVLLDSTACVAEAATRTSQLSRLFPELYFAYFERTPGTFGTMRFDQRGGEATVRNWPSSVAFLA